MLQAGRACFVGHKGDKECVLYKYISEREVFKKYELNLLTLGRSRVTNCMARNGPWVADSTSSCFKFSPLDCVDTKTAFRIKIVVVFLTQM